MRNTLVSIKGGYLPVIGGISVHISNLAEQLTKENLLHCVYRTSEANGYIENRFTVKNAAFSQLRYGVLKSLFWLIKNGLWDHAKIIHLHENPIWESPSLFLLNLFHRRIAYTVHDQMILDNLDKYPKSLTCLFKKVARSKNVQWIVVNPTIKKQFERFQSDCSNISIIPAYIPAKSDDKPLNPAIEKFIQSKAYVLSIYAHSFRDFNGKDLYGIDLALRAVGEMKKRSPNIGIVVSLPSKPGKDQMDIYSQLVSELQIQENVLFFFKPVNNPLNLWKRSDIVLRPTLTDGDSLVVREALDQGSKVVASDVVSRPEDVIVFRSEDLSDLVEKVTAALNTKKTNERRLDYSNYESIKNVYFKLIKE